MRRKFYINYFANLLFQIFSVIAPLVTTPYVARVLKADGVGIYSYTYAIATLFVTLGQFGTSTYGQREIAYKKDNIVERSKVFYNVVLLRALMVLISLIIYLPIFGAGQYGDIFIIQSLCIIGTAFDITWFYQGMENFSFVAIRDIICKIISIISVFLFVKNPNDIGLYTFILAMAIIGGRVVSWFPLRKYITCVPVKQINIFSNLKDIIALFIPQVAIQLNFVLDKGMIGLLTNNPSETGFYTQAERIITLIMFIGTSITTVMFPRISALYAQKKEKQIDGLVKKTLRCLWLLCMPASVGVALIIDMIVPWFLGNGYNKVILLTQVMCIKFIVVSISNSIGTLLLVARKREKEFVYCTTLGVIASIIFNLLLIPNMHATGAVISSLISSIIVFIGYLYYVKKQFNLLTIMKECVPYLLPTIVMTFIIVIVKNYLSATILDTVIIIVVGVSVYGVMLLITKEKIFMNFVVKIISFIKKKVFNIIK